MRVTWETLLLRDICQNVQYGHTSSASDEPIGPKFLRITDIASETIDWPSVSYCEIEANKKEKYLLKRGDIVIARTGATTGYAKYIKSAPESIFASYLVRLQLIDEVDPRYVGYVVESEAYKEFIQANWGGAAQPNANAQILTSFHVPTPPLSTQRKIAAILSAYDNLIENNLRRIKILEEMAQNLYREWFVKFRFPACAAGAAGRPGHQHARFTDSPLGKIPQGWEVATLGTVSNVIPGYAFKSKDWADDGIPVIKIKNIRPGNLIETDQVDHVSEGILSSTHKKYWLYNGDILIAMTGATAGKIGKLRGKKLMLLNQRVAKIEPKQHLNEFVWCTVSSPGAEGRFYALADGAAQPNMSGGQIENSELLVPPIDLMNQFNDIVSPFVNNVDNMILRNQSLRRTRGLLLPRLISGEVDVSELDIAVPEEVEE